MTIKIEKYGSLEEVNHMLLGGIVGGQLPNSGLISGLVGETITFTSPAGSHTFTQPSDAAAGLMRFKDIKSQLEGAIANLVVLLIDGKIGFKHGTAGSVASFGTDAQPAKPLLGFKSGVAVSGRFVNAPGGSAPALVNMAVSDFIYVSLVV